MSRKDARNAPISLRSRKLVCENAVFQVYFDYIEDERGNRVEDYLNVVPRHRAADKISGVAVLPVCEGAVALIRIYRYPLGQYCWEVPRGFVDRGETPESAALRELKEETGLVAAPTALRGLGVLAPEPGVLDARVALFVAEPCYSGTDVEELEMGHRDLQVFKQGEVMHMISRCEIVDPCTLVTSLQYFAGGVKSAYEAAQE